MIEPGNVIAGRLLLARVGNIVSVSTRDLRIDASGWGRLMQIPSGFRPESDKESAWWSVSGTLHQCIAYKTGSISLSLPSDRSIIRGNFTYPTSDQWPAAVPGTAE